jgi:hypothetical protein
VLPPHIRRPADAVFWIDAWLVSLGGEIVPGEYEGVSVIESAPAVVIAVQVGELRLRFNDGSELAVNVRLDSNLGVIKYTFDLIASGGLRRWGWHGHQEPNAGFHHLHLPGHHPEPAPEATFEAVRERLVGP